MPSMFYTASFERRFPLPFLFFEDIGIAAEAFGDSPTADDVEMAIRRSLKRCFPDMKVSKDDVAYVAERLEKFAAEMKKAEAEQSKEEPKKTKKDFASSYAQWTSQLKPEDVCLAAADMDYFLARRLYVEVDREDVTELSTQWMKREWEKIKIGYESVVYGFGGGYKEGAVDTEVNVSTDDNTQGKVIAPSALAAVKF